MSIKTLFLLPSLMACLQLQAQKPFKNSPKDHVLFLSLKPGVTFQHFNMGGTLGHMQYTAFPKFYTSANIDLEPNRWLILRLEVSYKPARVFVKGYPNAGQLYEYELQAHSFIPGGTILFKAPWKWKIQPYVGAGIADMNSSIKKNVLNVTAEGETKTTDNYLSLDEQDAPNFNFGILYAQNFEINLKFWRARWNRESNDYILLNDRSASLTVTYRFGFSGD